MNGELGTIYILPTDTCYGIACAFDDKKSYEKIYKIKKRSLDKPLAIMVKNYTWLRENTLLTDEQVDFLEQYKKPFTVLTDSPAARLFIEYHDDTEEYLINKDIYTHISFRVANNDIEESLIHEVGPVWLTSANLSGKGEIYSGEEIYDQFEYYIEKNIVQFLGTINYELGTVPPSDVFGFIGESLELEYIRKN